MFVDVDPVTLNLDPCEDRGGDHPADHRHHAGALLWPSLRRDRIQAIADTYGLKVIYDAAHAFGVKCPCGSVLTHGDLSVLSFHATKVFTTFEGGAIVCPDEKTRQRINYLKNFGFADEVTVVAPGINGKMSEFNAALGLLQLKGVDRALAQRQAIDARYRTLLAQVKGLRCLLPTGETGVQPRLLPHFGAARLPAEPRRPVRQIPRTATSWCGAISIR